MLQTSYIEPGYLDVRLFMQLLHYCVFIQHFGNVWALINNDILHFLYLLYDNSVTFRLITDEIRISSMENGICFIFYLYLQIFICLAYRNAQLRKILSSTIRDKFSASFIIIA